MKIFVNRRGGPCGRPGGDKPRPYEQGLQEDLLLFQQKDLYRKLRVLEPIDAVHARFEGRLLTLFCGNDYLGLSHDPRLQQAMQKAAAGGVGATASRLISGTSLWHQKLEHKIADFKKKEAALVYSAGYLANLGVLTALAGKDDCIVMDKLCHASLIDGARLSGASIRIFPHKNYERCEEILQNLSDSAGKKFLVSDTVFSMDGDLADITKLIEIKKRHGAILILDDAHGTGVMGSTGRGATENCELEIDVITGTLSKACAGLGGFAAASRAVCDYLINTSRPFIFATALPPPVCAAAYEAFSIFEESPQLREKLWNNINYFQPGAVSPIIPVILGPEKEALKAAQILLEKGFLCPAVRTPTVPKGKARLRITISAAHQKSDLAALLAALKDCSGASCKAMG